MTHKVKVHAKPEWSSVQDKSKHYWMRTERNKIIIIYDNITVVNNIPQQSNLWDGDCTFDEEVLWNQMIEIGDLYIFPSNFDDCIILDKNKLLTGRQSFWHWRTKHYYDYSWKDRVIYSTVKKYNYQKRYDCKNGFK